MDEDTTRPDSKFIGRGDVTGIAEPEPVRRTRDYLRRLIIEAPYIMERIHNPGGSVITSATADPSQQYGSTIGSAWHNDLIEAGMILSQDFSAQERKELYTWAYSMSSEQAAHFTNVKGSVTFRKRRERALDKFEKAMNDDTV
jgi:hypothetical protein